MTRDDPVSRSGLEVVSESFVMLKMKAFQRTLYLSPVILLAACNDLRLYDVYDDLEDVRREGAIERGWIPDWVPESATDIHDHHELDTNLRAVSFRIDNSKSFDWPNTCSPADTVTPPELRTRLFPKAVHALKNIHKCADLFGVQDDQGVIHLWSKRINN